MPNKGLWLGLMCAMKKGYRFIKEKAMSAQCGIVFPNDDNQETSQCKSLNNFRLYCFRHVPCAN